MRMPSASWSPSGPREDSQCFPPAMERVLRVLNCAATPTIFSSTQSAGASTSAAARVSSTSSTHARATIVASPECRRSEARALLISFSPWTGCFSRCGRHRWSRPPCGRTGRCLEWVSKGWRGNEASDFEDQVFIIPYVRGGYRRRHGRLDGFIRISAVRRYRCGGGRSARGGNRVGASRNTAAERADLADRAVHDLQLWLRKKLGIRVSRSGTISADEFRRKPQHQRRRGISQGCVEGGEPPGRQRTEHCD